MGDCVSAEKSRSGAYAAEENHHSGEGADRGLPLVSATTLHSDFCFGVTSLHDHEFNTQVITCSEDRTITHYDYEADQVLNTWRGHTHTVNDVVYARKLRAVVSASRDKSVRVWRDGEEEAVAVLSGHEASVSAVDVLHDGALVCSGSGHDYSLRTWDVAAGEQVTCFRKNRNVITDLCCVPGEATVFFSSEDLMLRLYDARADALVSEVSSGGEHFVRCVSVSDDGLHLLTGYNGFSAASGGAVKLWDRRQLREPVHTLPGHEHAVVAVAFAPTRDSLVLSASRDGSLHMWDTTAASPLVHSTRPVGHAHYFSGLATSASNSRVFASTFGGSLNVFDVLADPPSLQLAFHTQLPDDD